MVGRILKYSDFYNDIPINKFDLIKNIPKIEIISTISGINNTIKSALSLDFNNSLENQKNILNLIYLVRSNPNNNRYSLKHKIKLEEIYKNTKGNIVLFTRVSCLSALNETIFSNEFINENQDSFNFSINDLENTFKFLLICNRDLLNYSNNYRDEVTFEKLGKQFFEVSMFKEIPHNQYYYIQNPLNLLQRAVNLFAYINLEYKDELVAYLKAYNINSPKEYIAIIGKFFMSKGISSEVHSFKVPLSDTQTILRLNKLSERGNGSVNTGIKKFQFLEIKKSPFYRYESDNFNFYILMDNIFFIEKCYDLFYWDFYFDKLSKGLNVEQRTNTLKKWGGLVGRFFEDHIKNIFTYSFANQRDIIFKSTDELIVKNGKELADFYIRRKRQVIVGQAKCSYLPQLKYKEINSLDDYNSIDKDAFYEKFGLNQLVSTTIKKFREYAIQIDSKLPKNKLFIYPILLVNEPIVSNGIVSYNFNQKFLELLQKEGIKIDNNKIRIHRLTIIHINELEKIQQTLHDKDTKFDYLLKAYANNTNINLTKNPYSSFLNFDNLIKKKIKSKAIPNYILDKEKGIFKLLIESLNLK